MGPYLRPVFPGVGAGIGTDEIVLPVRWWSLAVVPVQSLLVIDALITEQFPKGAVSRGVLHQAIPVVVADLVAEMAEQGPIRFVLPRALALPVHIVGFG